MLVQNEIQYGPTVLFKQIVGQTKIYERDIGTQLSESVKTMFSKAGNRGLPQVCIVPSQTHLYPMNARPDPSKTEVRKQLFHLMVLPAANSATTGEGVKGGGMHTMHPCMPCIDACRACQACHACPDTSSPCIDTSNPCIDTCYLSLRAQVGISKLMALLPSTLAPSPRSLMENS